MTLKQKQHILFLNVSFTVKNCPPHFHAVLILIAFPISSILFCYELPHFQILCLPLPLTQSLDTAPSLVWKPHFINELRLRLTTVQQNGSFTDPVLTAHFFTSFQASHLPKLLSLDTTPSHTPLSSHLHSQKYTETTKSK